MPAEQAAELAAMVRGLTALDVRSLASVARKRARKNPISYLAKLVAEEGANEVRRREQAEAARRRAEAEAERKRRAERQHQATAMAEQRATRDWLASLSDDERDRLRALAAERYPVVAESSKKRQISSMLGALMRKLAEGEQEEAAARLEPQASAGVA